MICWGLLIFKSMPSFLCRPTTGEAMPGDIFPDLAVLSALCQRHHIRRLALFGSTLAGNARPDSDIDLLVEFAGDSEPGLMQLAGICEELEALTGGRRVDLRTASDLSPHFRSIVMREAKVQYAA